MTYCLSLNVLGASEWVPGLPEQFQLGDSHDVVARWEGEPLPLQWLTRAGASSVWVAHSHG